MDLVICGPDEGQTWVSQSELSSRGQKVRIRPCLLSEGGNRKLVSAALTGHEVRG